jgi:hypothetical protein
MVSLDQSQYINNAAFGFGEFAIVRYRGQGFIPTLPVLTGISFNRDLPSIGIKVYIDTADANSIPTHAVGSELYSFVIPQSQVINAFQRFNLPEPLIVTPGNQYCFYLAPWNTGSNAYADDYRDCHGSSSQQYANGKEITNTNGSWSNENLSFMFEIYGRQLASSDHFKRSNRPKPFVPGLAR